MPTGSGFVAKNINMQANQTKACLKRFILASLVANSFVEDSQPDFSFDASGSSFQDEILYHFIP